MIRVWHGVQPDQDTISRLMSDGISEYQKWKQQGDDLRLKAKQSMESRFRELLSEAARIAEEYRHDFGSVLKPPTSSFHNLLSLCSSDPWRHPPETEDPRVVARHVPRSLYSFFFSA
jgi:hypothetical protein